MIELLIFYMINTEYKIWGTKFCKIEIILFYDEI